MTVALTVEQWLNAVAVRGLALESPGRAGARRNIAKAKAADLATRHENLPSKNCVFAKLNRMNLSLSKNGRSENAKTDMSDGAARGADRFALRTSGIKK